MTKSFIKSSSIVTVMTFLSRILGLARDFIIARYFGANDLSDAFLVAFRIPNFFRRLFAEGAFSQAFIPILADAKANQSDDEVQTVINHIATKLLSVLMIITLIAVILAFVRPDEETKFSLVLLTGLSLTLESLQPE